MKNLRKLSGVYKITCTATGQIYLGSSKNIGQRWSGHKSAMRGGYHNNKHMQAAFDQHGEAAFKIEVLQACPQEMLLDNEQQYLDQHADQEHLMNICPDAGSPKGLKLSDETKAKMSRGKDHMKVSCWGRKLGTTEWIPFESQMAAARFIGGNPGGISQCLSGKIKQHAGWEFKRKAGK